MQQARGFNSLKTWIRKNREEVTAWSILTPVLLYYTIFTILPLIFLFAISFTKWDMFSWPPQFVGLENFLLILRKPFYLRVLLRTIGYAIAILSINLTGGFIIALLLNQQLTGKGIYRTLWYLPSVFSAAVIAKVLQNFLNPSSAGILNMILGFFGIEPVAWFFSKLWMPVFMILYAVWQGIGWSVIFFLAGLQSIDIALDEAARIDGANYFQVLRYIIIPQLIPIIIFISATGLVSSVQLWEVPMIITQGGPGETTLTLVFSMYIESYSNLRYGIGTAQGVAMLLLLSVVIGWQLRQYYKQYQR